MTIYVELLGEGTLVWRPAEAVALGDGRFEVVTIEHYDQEDELWAFPPGSVVRCDEVVRNGDRILVARQAVEAG